MEVGSITIIQKGRYSPYGSRTAHIIIAFFLILFSSSFLLNEQFEVEAKGIVLVLTLILAIILLIRIVNYSSDVD